MYMQASVRDIETGVESMLGQRPSRWFKTDSTPVQWLESAGLESIISEMILPQQPKYTGCTLAQYWANALLVGPTSRQRRAEVSCRWDCIVYLTEVETKVIIIIRRKFGMYNPRVRAHTLLYSNYYYYYKVFLFALISSRVADHCAYNEMV